MRNNDNIEYGGAGMKENNMIFKTNSLFDSIEYNKEADIWIFSFTNNIYINAQTIWRFLKNKKIKLVSFDNEQYFGHQTPFNLIDELTSELTGKFLLEIIIKPYTSDLLLNFTDNLQIEIFISSSGYESYNLSIANKNYIGMGAGEITILDN